MSSKITNPDPHWPLTSLMLNDATQHVPSNFRRPCCRLEMWYGDERGDLCSPPGKKATNRQDIAWSTYRLSRKPPQGSPMKSHVHASRYLNDCEIVPISRISRHIQTKSNAIFRAMRFSFFVCDNRCVASTTFSD